MANGKTKAEQDFAKLNPREAVPSKYRIFAEAFYSAHGGFLCTYCRNNALYTFSKYPHWAPSQRSLKSWRLKTMFYTSLASTERCYCPSMEKKDLLIKYAKRCYSIFTYICLWDSQYTLAYQRISRKKPKTHLSRKNITFHSVLYPIRSTELFSISQEHILRNFLTRCYITFLLLLSPDITNFMA